MATIRELVVRISVTEKTDKGVRKVTTSLRETNRELDRANKNSNLFSSALQRVQRFASFGGLLADAKKLSGLLLKLGKGLLVVGAAAAAMNTAIQAGAAFAPLTGLLALLPGMALAAAAAFGTLKLATSGVGDAFKAAMSGDNKKFAESLKNLAPAAKTVAGELHRLRPELLGIRNAAQQALFAPLVGQLTATAKVLAGPVRQGASQVAHEFGLAGAQVGAFLRQSATVGVLRSQFAVVAVSVHALLPAIQPVLAGFRDLAEVGSSFLPGIASSVSTVAARFGTWMQQMVATGKAAQWIQNALATLKQLGQVIGNVGGILKSVFSAASATGSSFLGVIGAALAKLNAFLKTAQGQSALQGIFVGLAEIGTALGPVIAALVTGLGTLAAPIGRLVQLIGPILTAAINALAPALAALEPGLAAIFGALGQAVTILAPALMPIARMFSQIAAALAPILPLVATLVGQLVSALAPIIGQLAVALSPLIKAVVQLAGAFTPLIPPIAQIIVQLVQGLVPAITPLVPVLSKLVQVVGGFLVQAFGILMRALIPLLPTITGLAVTFINQLLPVMVQLSPALLNILKALMPLLPALVQLAPPILQTILAATPLVALLLQIAAVILEHLLPPVVKLATFLTDVLAVALNFVATVATKITNAVVGAFRWLYNTLIGHSIIPDLVNGMIRWFGSLPGKIVRFFYNIAKGAAEQLTGLIKWVAGVPGKILHALGNTGKLLYQAGKNVVIGLWNGIASLGNWLFNRVWSWVKAVLPGPVKFALGIHSPSKVMAQLGTFAGQGLAQGILGTAGTVASAAGTLARAAVPAIPNAAAMAAPAGAVAASAPRGVAAAGGQGATITLEIRSAGSRLDDLLVETLRKAVRVKGGGNVQVALGGG